MFFFTLDKEESNMLINILYKKYKKETDETKDNLHNKIVHFLESRKNLDLKNMKNLRSSRMKKKLSINVNFSANLFEDINLNVSDERSFSILKRNPRRIITLL